MLRFSASVGFRLLWWMKNLHLSCKALQVPVRSPCNLHSSFTINVQLDSLRCSKTLAMIMFLNCDNGIGQVSKFTCQPSKRMQRSSNYIHSSISKAQKTVVLIMACSNLIPGVLKIVKSKETYLKSMFDGNVNSVSSPVRKEGVTREACAC